MKPQKIEISFKTIAMILGTLIALAVLWKIKDIIAIFFICVMFMEAINPIVSRIEKFKIPRILSITIVYLLIIAVLVVAVAVIVPILVEQTTSLINTIPGLIENIEVLGFSIKEIPNQLKLIENIPSGIANFTFGIVSNIFSGFIIFMITLYLLLERKNIPKYAEKVFGKKGHLKSILIMDRLEKKLGSWVNAQIILMLIIGIISYLGYLVLGLKYAVPLALLAGILEIVPTMGPIVATIIAGLVGLISSPLTAVLTLAWGTVVQQLENNFIVPKLMKEAVDLNPIVTILLIAAGAKLGGVLGALLAIPLYLTVEVVIKTIRE